VQPSVLARLLDLQEQDTAIRLLHHRKKTLPEAAELSRLEGQLAELQADVEIADKRCSEVTRALGRLEGDIELLSRKIEREEKRLFSGSVANPRELGALQAEVDMNRRNKARLEDEVLEVMVAKDQAEDTLQRLELERSDAEGHATTLGASVDEISSAIDAELGARASRRDEIARELPAELLSVYDRIRDAKGGVGAAALVDGTCQGCHTQLPARDVERMRREGGLQRCDNCGRILVVER
jgi:predicted  nucleic acid-binding Zn-ribbon protein